jgi:preprotein translocase subunit SecF
MRRKIGYWLLSGTLLLGAAALIGPTIVGLDTDITFGSGQDLVYKISKKDTTANGVLVSDYIDTGTEAVDTVGAEMESRLKTWGIEADVMKEGSDTIRVRLRAQANDDTDYTYLENYLSFSGGRITVGGSEDSTDEYLKTVKDSWSTMFDDQTARIEYVKVSTGSVPAVVIPVNSTGKDGDFGSLVTYCTNHTKEANSSEGTAAENCYLVLWNNKQEGDTYAKATSSGDDADSNVSKRLIFAENAANAWFTEDNTDDDYTEFQLIPSSAALTSDGYNPNKADAAYKAAFFYMNILNCSDYATLGNGYDVNFAFSSVVDSTVENLVNAGSWSLHPALGATFIATIVSLLFGIGLLIAFYKQGSLAILSNVAIAIMGSLLLFDYFKAQFGIGALMGLILGALLTAFGGMYYFSKLREQLYQGRSTKKAHQEAIKRSMWPTIDGSVIAIIMGLCIYGWIPSVVGKAGLMLIFSAFFGGISNLLVLRLEGWLLANDMDSQDKLGKVYGIEMEKVPDLAKDEKPSYFGPYAQHDFAKHSKTIGIISAALVVASLVGMGVFMGLNEGTAYNYSSSYDDTTIAYVEYRADANSLLAFNDESELTDKILSKVTIDGTAVPVTSVKLESSSIYLTEEEKSVNVYYYTVRFTSYYDPNSTATVFTYAGASYTDLNSALKDAAEAVVTNYLPESTEMTGIAVKVENVQGQVGQPSMGSVWLGMGVGILLSGVYMALRYKLSRGISATLLSLGAGSLVIGLFALTRIPVTSIVSLGAIATAFIVFLLTLFILPKEKELHRDSREKDKDSLEFHSLCLTTANRQAAGEVVIFSFLAAFTGIWYMGLGPSKWMMLFVGCLVGLVTSVIFALNLLTPLSIALAKLLSRINISFKPKKKETSSSGHRSAEPEEAIFIGIND